MAFHGANRGHTMAIVGKMYCRALGTHGHEFRCKLKLYNKATGLCKMETLWGTVFWITESELSNWHMIGE